MASGNVIEVTDGSFESDVIARSHQVPVLVDFWAPWCGPCRILSPILEKLADEMAGAFLLAEVNTDENPGLAAAFQIQSIPTVHLLKDGRVVDGFMGALPEVKVRAFLEPHVKGQPEHADEVARARDLLERGKTAEARAALRSHLEKSPGDAAARLLAARAALDAGDEAGARAELDAIPEEAETERREGERLRGALQFRSACGEGEAHWRARLAEAPEDLAARYALGCCLAANGRHEEALAALLEVVKRDKTFEDGAARKAMVAIFGLLGPGSDLAQRFRKQLVIYL